MRKFERNKRKGFTLVEILVVVVILGLLAGIVANNLGARAEEARRTAAVVQMKEVESALDIYRLHNGFYPTTEQGLMALVTKPSSSPQPKRYADEAYMKRVPKDPWDNDFVYRSPGERGGIDIISYGSDGEEGGEGTAKDITNHDE